MGHELVYVEEISYISKMQRCGWIVRLNELTGMGRLTAVLSGGGFGYDKTNSIGHFNLGSSNICKAVAITVGGITVEKIPIAKF